MANMQPSVVHASSFVNIIKKGIYYKFFRFSYLASSEHAQPPALQAARVLFQNGEDVSFAESQFVGRLGDVVVQGPRHTVLQETA